MRFILLLSVLLTYAFTFTTYRTTDYPQDYFRSPVDHTIYLSGTFGELRPNHFHAGIDIKSRNGKVGQPLFAVADGYVSRIKVQSGSYGNVLYFNHPRGYTTVYAHLHEFPKEISDYIKQKQYEQQTFEIELFPNPDQFFYKKGEVVGKLGTTGRSFGPHLHFEIRDTQTEKPINPQLFGFPIKDNIPPKLHQLKVYYLNKKQETIGTKTYDVYKSGNRYRIKGDTLALGAWRIGMAIKAYDHMEGAHNWNGVYQIDMLNDDSLWYNTTMETFSFDETRYINAHLDYEEQVSQKSYFNRCFKLPGNDLSVYNVQVDEGIIPLSKHKKNKISFEVSDTDGNTSRLEFWVKRGDVKAPESGTYNYVLPYNEENIIKNSAVEIYFPKGALYEDLYLQYQSSADPSSGVYSSVHHLHNFKTPVHTYYDLSIRPIGLPDSLRSKAFIGYCDKKDNVINCGGEWNNGWLKAKVRDLGDFSILIDEIAPKIAPVSFKSNMRGYNRMSFKITDNLPTARNVKGLQFDATIDGKWVLMNYDAKNDLLTHRFEDDLESGEHEFRLSLRDQQGNETIFERTFLR